MVSLLLAALLLLPSVVVVPGVRRAMAGQAPETLIFAGCDANIPLTRLLARAFMQRRPEVSIQLATVGSPTASPWRQPERSRSAWSRVVFARARKDSGSSSARTLGPR
jgi:hypothetical protein